MPTDDPFELARFVQAQAPVLADVRRELAAGRKRTHWMWFIFPQLRGLGRSPMAQRYGIASLAEARAYLEHPVLGARLIKCTELVNRHEGASAAAIFGSPDDMKFHSAMTLFHLAWPQEPVFHAALERHHGGRLDQSTVDGLAGGS